MTSISNPSLSRTARTVILAAATFIFLAGCGGQDKPHQMPPAAVEVMVVQPQKVPLVRPATGRLSAYRSADARARVSGVVLKRTYTEGTHVDKDQVLFQIDPAPLKATLDAAKANLAQTQATYTNARVAAKRVRKLAPKGYVSQADLDNAEAAERTAKAAVQAARAKADSARISLGYATVRAPISGRAGKQQVTEGALVGQNGPTLLTTVRQIDPLYVNFSLPVSEMQQLRTSQSSGSTTLADGKQTFVQLALPNGNDYAHEGTLDFTGIAVDQTTGSVTLRAVIPNPDHVLLPGMYASMKVHLGTINKAYLIPQNAVQRDANEAYVLVVDKDNKVVRKNVQTMEMRGGNWIITHGLSAGEHVIVSGIPKARIGSKVNPKLKATTTPDANKQNPPAQAASQAAPASSSGGHAAAPKL